MPNLSGLCTQFLLEFGVVGLFSGVNGGGVVGVVCWSGVRGVRNLFPCVSSGSLIMSPMVEYPMMSMRVSMMDSPCTALACSASKRFPPDFWMRLLRRAILSYIRTMIPLRPNIIMFLGP